MSPRLEVDLGLDLPGFTLAVAWQAGDGVAALFGPSGAGKTLTLQCLAGLLRPGRGRIVVDGRVLFDAAAGIDVPPQERRVGYVFQRQALFPHLSVRENVAFGLRHLERAERSRRAAAQMERLGLAELADRRPAALSGGQRQRVALARALAPAPALLLLDEPFSALDEPTRRAFRDELRATLGAAGCCAVVVTHDLAEAYQLGDRIVVVDGGRVIQSAPRADLLWRPASEAVARIMGARNLLHGVVVEATPERIRLAWRGHTLDAVNSPRHAYLPAPGTPLAFFVRPEYVRLVRKDRAPDPAHHANVLRGAVVAAIDRGTTWTLHLRLEQPGAPAQGEHDLEVEVPRLVYEILGLERDHAWSVSIHRGSIQVLPGD
ncbi:MAG TPA: ABC transporter ATP-binding protein [Polyangia bacterium]